MRRALFHLGYIQRAVSLLYSAHFSSLAFLIEQVFSREKSETLKQNEQFPASPNRERPSVPGVPSARLNRKAASNESRKEPVTMA